MIKPLRSLWFKLVGAFAAVIAVTILVVTSTVNRAIEQQFDEYLVGSGQAWTEMMAPMLAEHYERAGSWGDAESLLENPWIMPPAPIMGIMNTNSRLSFVVDTDFWQRMGWRMLLADEDGVIIADTSDSLQGTQLSNESLESGTPIIVRDNRVGTVIFATPVDYAPFQQSFLQAVNRAVFAAGIAAGAMGVLIGTLLFLAVTQPMRKLRTAAEAVADGDLTARVDVRTKDEMGTLAAAFNRMANELLTQRRLRRQMVADIAHELRTPISVIQGTLEAMLDGVLPASPAELNHLHGESRRLARLVEDLRTLSLADAGQLTLVKEPIDIAALIRRIIIRMAPLADVRDVKLELTQLPDSLTAHIDPDRIAQVIANLVDNALRYTPPTGNVRVALEQSEEHAIITISDNGSGISEKDLPYIFERFWRGDKSRSRDAGGTGLGLAIVKQLIEMHGGQVQAESKVGKGTRFIIRLPLDSETTEPTDHVPPHVETSPTPHPAY